MTKTHGRSYRFVVERLHELGVSSEGVAVATLCRGADHLIMRGDDVIGEYNHVSKRVRLYKNE